MNESLKKIAVDSVSGSSELLVKLSRLYKSRLHNIPELKKLLAESGKYFSSFALIINYIKSVQNAVNKKDEELIRKAVLSPINKDNIYEEIFANSLPYIKNLNSVFTFSNSKTIREIILLLNNYKKGKLKLFITESRPKYEAKILADVLLKNNIKITYGTDSQIPAFVENTDAVFLGADKIFKDGSVVNKTGSMSAAITAAYFKKPLYIFAESGKISSSFRKEEKDPGEIWRKHNQGLKIVNNYFEKIPAKLITKIFTEKAV